VSGAEGKGKKAGGYPKEVNEFTVSDSNRKGTPDLQSAREKAGWFYGVESSWVGLF